MTEDQGKSLEPDPVIRSMPLDEQGGGQQRSWYVDHIQELRKRVFICSLAIVLSWIAVFFYLGPMMKVLFQFAYSGYDLIPGSLMGPFQVGLRISFAFAFLFALPVILYQIWAFISPGLLQREKKWIFVLFPVVMGLFLLGCWLGSLVIFPWARDFFGDFNRSVGLRGQYVLGDAFRDFVVIVIPCGLIFEIPVLVWGLAQLQIITAAGLKRARRIAYLLMLVFAAALSPGDFSLQTVIFIVFLLFSYEASIAWLVWRESRSGEGGRGF